MLKKLLLIFSSLLFAVFIYITYRSRSLFYFNIFRYYGLEDNIIEYRKFAFLYRRHIPNWVIYALPDGLWHFSFGIALLYRSRKIFYDFILFTFITFFMIAFEMFQLTFGGHGTVLGTYDVSDIYCFIGAYFLVVFLSYSREVAARHLKGNYFRSEKVTPSFIDFTKHIFVKLLVITLFSVLAVLPTLYKIKF